MPLIVLHCSLCADRFEMEMVKRPSGAWSVPNREFVFTIGDTPTPGYDLNLEVTCPNCVEGICKAIYDAQVRMKYKRNEEEV